MLFRSMIDKIVDALFQIQGGYALVMLTNNALIGARDPFGIRPLIIGKLKNSYIFASETCALDIIGAKSVIPTSAMLSFISIHSCSFVNRISDIENLQMSQVKNPTLVCRNEYQLLLHHKACFRSRSELFVHRRH